MHYRIDLEWINMNAFDVTTVCSVDSIWLIFRLSHLMFYNYTPWVLKDFLNLAASRNIISRYTNGYYLLVDSEFYHHIPYYTLNHYSLSSWFRFELLAAVDNSAKFYKAAVGRDTRFTLILTIHGAVPKYLRLFLLSEEAEAAGLFSLYSSRILPIVAACKQMSSSTSKLQVWVLFFRWVNNSYSLV